MNRMKTRSARSLTEPYCPNCRRFCGEEACAQCGRSPVQMQVLSRSFFYCTRHEAWHEGMPCSDQRSLDCCTQRRAYAVRAPKKRLQKGLYCPGCAAFSGAEWPTDAHGVCHGCGRQTVEVYGLDRMWMWCGGHRMWHDAPCEEHETLAAHATLLALPT